ncbi:MAG: hypothetical protein KF764_21790 [Labilithrix sp.]|nr:hypothetical protein [Labilithrix sp.]MBX3225019.1 hypothetical protein [Labilithrix sp.]
MASSSLCLRASSAAGAIACALSLTSAAGAQPGPAPAPPPAQYQPPPGQYQPPPPGYGQPPPQGYGQGYPPPQQPYYYPQQPPPQQVVPVAPPEPETHAPKYSLWTGARLSYVGFGFSFYDNDRGQSETTGNFLGNGVAPQIDVGARISYRYIPYLFWEHGFMGQGHRFDGSQARSSTDFYGIGFRYVSGDVDSVAFLTDLSIGKRVVTVSNGTQTYSMSGIEFFRLGLGAEIRVATLFALTPLFSISSGALNDSEGDIAFTCSPNCADGVQGPTYKNGQVIQSARAYVVVSLGLGIHFDIFGK